MRPRKNLELHVRCVPDEEQVQLYLELEDGSTVSLNRYKYCRTSKIRHPACRIWLQQCIDRDQTLVVDPVRLAA